MSNTDDEQKSLIDKCYLKNGHARVPLKGLMDLIDSLLVVQWNEIVITRTQPADVTAIGKKSNDQNNQNLSFQLGDVKSDIESNIKMEPNVSHAFHPTVPVKPNHLNVGDCQNNNKSLFSHRISTSTETIFSLSNRKLLMDQLIPVLKALQQESVNNVSQKQHYTNYWIFRLQRTIELLQDIIQAEERK
ncbi:unnamed protein product [Rotaria magnacalcarata]|nr:unnamed protein product [Rotaria magnacalcarata]CAF2056336.1 unnamed protein product [Rotaria magnacalcarata]CAF3814915.1 unnamed protein product [Rotaria magnacalcarata]CAF3973084.1 unnamed protein product [Rotaria magnacalcarata]CAF4087101.1 unnamed protein product [Rotaria magnacalcarata]